MNTPTTYPAQARSGRGWAYTGAILGGLVSIAANVAHSFIVPHGASADWEPEPGAVVGAVVWPVFLFVAVEILARVRWPHGWGWQLTRWGGLLPVTTVAAIVSYRHLSGLLQHYGEEPLVYLLGPLAVDGLMVMATAALMATGRYRHQPAQQAAPSPLTESAANPIPATFIGPTTIPVPPTVPVPSPTVSTAPVTSPDTIQTVVPAAPKPAEVSVPTPAAVAERIAPKPVTATRSTRAASGPDRQSTRPRSSAPVGPAAALTASSTDSPVTATDAAQLVLPLADPALLKRATEVARQFRAENGTRITTGQLAVRLRVTTDQATQLLKAIDDTPEPATTVNGSPVKAT